MKFFFTIIIWIIGVVVCSATDYLNYQKTAEGVRDKLVIAFGNQLETAPRIEVVAEKIIANYKTGKKLISLEITVFDFCRQFGQDSLDVLAFIIGHELSHHFRKKRGTFGFAKDCISNEALSIKAEERQADIWGAFTAFLAGYKTIELLPEIMKGLYKEFKLNENLEGYPSYDERAQTDLVVYEEVNRMSELHKAAIWLTALGEYELAAANYEYIVQFYPSKEIYNNIGVNYALQAMHIRKETVDKFVYPFELVWTTHLSAIKKSRGEELSIGEQAVRKSFLEKAIQALMIVKKQDKKYLLNQLNLINVYALFGKGVNDYAYPKKGVKLYEKLLRKGWLVDSPLKTKFQMAYALACFRSNQRGYIQDGKESLKNIIKEDKGLLSSQAVFNLHSFETNYKDVKFSPITYDCPKELTELLFKENEDLVYRNVGDKAILLNDRTRVELQRTKESINLTYEEGQEYSFFLERQFSPNINKSIIVSIGTEESSCSWIATNTGGLLISKKDNSGLLINQQNKVVEAMKFFQVEE